MIWDSNKIQGFRDAINAIHFQTNVNNVKKILNNNIDESVNQFTSFFLNAAGEMKNSTRIDNKKPKVLTIWFDQDCVVLKKKVKSYLNKYRNHRNEIA